LVLGLFKRPSTLHRHFSSPSDAQKLPHHAHQQLIMDILPEINVVAVS
jgi:hypothetical protein